MVDDLRRRDVGAAGGKGANLGELVGAGFPVPPGFVISAAPTWPRWRPQACGGGRRDRGGRRRPEWPAPTRRPWSRKAGGAPRAPRTGAPRSRRPTGWARTSRVAVRSSAIARTRRHLVRRHEDVHRRARRARVARSGWRAGCRSSVTGRSPTARPGHHGRAGHRRRRAGDGPQRARRACLHRRPGQGQRDRIVVEAAFGVRRGRRRRTGRARHVRARPHGRIAGRRIGTRTPQIVARGDGDVHRGTRRRPRPPAGARPTTAGDWRGSASPSRPTTASPRTSSGDRPRASWIVQTRPITTLGGRARPAPPPQPRRRAPAGSRHAPGRASGPSGCSLTRRGQRLLEGEVLVAPMTNPDWVPALRRAAAHRHRRRRRHVPCRHRQPRARHPLRRRRAHGDHASCATARSSPSTAPPGWCRRDGRPAPVDGGAVPAPRPRLVGAAEPLGTRLYVNLAIADAGRARSPRCRSTASVCCAPSSWSRTR